MHILGVNMCAMWESVNEKPALKGAIDTYPLSVSYVLREPWTIILESRRSNIQLPKCQDAPCRHSQKCSSYLKFQIPYSYITL